MKVLYMSPALATYLVGTQDEDSQWIIPPALPKWNETDPDWATTEDLDHGPAAWSAGVPNTNDTLRRWAADFSPVTTAAIEQFIIAPPLEGEIVGFFMCSGLGQENAIMNAMPVPWETEEE